MVSEVDSEDEEMTETYLEGESEQVREKHPRSSVVWQYFETPNREERTAVCKCCQETLSYKSSISNLKKHLQRKHKMFEKLKLEDEVMTETYLEEESDEDEEKDKRKTLRSGVWEYFMVTDEEQRMANCQLCNEEFSYRTTSSNLSRHLRRRHCIGTPLKHSDTENDDAGDKSVVVHKSRNKKSIAWDYFTIKDNIKKIATCKVCDRDCSYYTSTSNLVKHVRRKHGMGYFVDVHVEDDDLNSKESDGVAHRRSSLWLYFKCVDKEANIAMCLICKKRLSYLTSITNLKRHLTRKHPNLQVDGIMDGKNMLLASDGQLYEIDDSEQTEVLDSNDDDADDQNADPMEIYLDEAEGKIVTKRTKQPVKVKKLLVDESNDSTDNEITLEKRYIKKNNDSLDKFGKYLVSLLRELPPAVSNQLQADFVKQIMNFQNNETVKINNHYVTTITECGVDETLAVSSASNDDALLNTDNS